MPWPARLNEARAAEAASRHAGLAAAIIADRELLGTLTRSEQLVVAKRYLEPEASWASIGAQLGMTKYQVSNAWRRAAAKARGR